MKKIVSLMLCALLVMGLAMPVAAASRTHVVQEGEVLWRIAQAHGITYRELADYNDLRSPHLIFPGQQLAIPGHAPAYVAQAAANLYPTFQPVILGHGTAWPVAGMLTFPAGAGAHAPVPGIVIVHGSGAHDMDGTLYPPGITPYLDMALHFADSGIATLRHDKRNLVHVDALLADPLLLGAFTVWEESIEDALHAAAMLHADPRIDSSRIYLLGHSLGGMLAPRIQVAAQQAGTPFAGLILMAATPREMTEVVMEQLNASLAAGYAQVAAMAPFLSEQDLFAAQLELEIAQEEIDFITEVISMIWDTPAEYARQMFVMGASFYYFQDMAAHPFEAMVALTDVPMLVLQGQRDFQVRYDVDFALLANMLHGRAHTTFILYPDLNHMFMPSQATTFIEHALEIIMLPQQVCDTVLGDVAAWVLAR